eukprot:scaffold3149_cov118-Isochrysis_galbana.AAC.1
MAQDPPGASSRARSARTHRVACRVPAVWPVLRAARVGSSTFCHGRSGALRLRAIAHSGHTALKTVSRTTRRVVTCHTCHRAKAQLQQWEHVDSVVIDIRAVSTPMVAPETITRHSWSPTDRRLGRVPVTQHEHEADTQRVTTGYKWN